VTKPDNTRFLAQANAERRQATLGRARAAIEQLDRNGQPVTFCSVARTAGISRAWLYRESDIHNTIVSLRSAGPPVTAGIPSAQRRTTESLREQLDAARAEITRLKSDNTTVRDHLARQLGTERASGNYKPANPH
jgi:hypothetical protein